MDLSPDHDYDAVFDQLVILADEQELLAFETCEPRIEGSFDDLPAEVLPGVGGPPADEEE